MTVVRAVLYFVVCNIEGCETQSYVMSTSPEGAYEYAVGVGWKHDADTGASLCKRHHKESLRRQETPFPVEGHAFRVELLEDFHGRQSVGRGYCGYRRWFCECGFIYGDQPGMGQGTARRLHREHKHAALVPEVENE